MFRIVADSEIESCYYAGRIYGWDYANDESKTIHCVNLFVNEIDMSPIKNCYAVNLNKAYVKDAIGQCENIRYDLTVYDSIEQMYSLADKLNKNPQKPVWINVENGLPKLKFQLY